MNNSRAKEEGLIKPIKSRRDPEIDDYVFMIMIPDILKYLLRTSKYKKVSSNPMNFFNIYRIKHKNGSFSSLAGPFLGAPQAVMGMEKLIALGSKRIWILGYCGSLNSELKIGDILIPVDAISEEGTSQHYPVGKKIETDRGLNKQLEKHLRGKNLPYKSGKVWTTDAPYRETAKKVETYRDAGVMAVEMELSALMTVAIYRDVKLSGLLVVSDELFDVKWRPGFSSPLLKKKSRQAGELILELIS